jgi:hypothetical protein
MNVNVLHLPKDTLINVLSFDDRFIIKKGNIYNYNKISKSDERYIILKSLPIKYYNNREKKWEVDLNIGYDFINKGYKFIKIFVSNSNLNKCYKIYINTLIDVGSIYAYKLINNEEYILN